MERNQAKIAAAYLEGLWKAYYDRNIGAGWSSAQRLYELLGAPVEKASIAGRLTIEAIRIADTASSRRLDGDDIESFYYDIARQHLAKARVLCGMEPHSAGHIVQAWKARNNGDFGKYSEAVEGWHMSEFSGLQARERELYAKECTNRFVSASFVWQDSRGSEKTFQMLEKYFETYFEALRERNIATKTKIESNG